MSSTQHLTCVKERSRENTSLPEIQSAAKVAGDLLRRSREQNREKIKEEQGLLFDDLYDEE